VPPGHYVTPDFPVLSAGSTPHDAIERWSFEIRGEGRPDRCRAHRWAHGWQDIRVTAAAEGQDLFPPRPIAMSRRLLQRRQFDQSVRERLIDEALARYLDWLAESEAVKAAYGGVVEGGADRRRGPVRRVPRGP